MHLIVSLLAFLGVLQFVGAVVIAIHCYSGGYSVFDNFISDLGCFRTPMGGDNSISAAVFNLSAIILGASLIPFFWILPSTISKLQKTVWLSGTLSALGLIGIGLTPYDLFFAVHILALGLWIVPMFVLLITHLLATVEEGQSSRARTAWTILLLVAILLYVSAGTHSAYVVTQKLTAVVAIIWFSLIGTSIGTTVVQVVSPRRQMIEQAAEKYTKVLQSGQCLKTGKSSDTNLNSPLPHNKNRSGRI